MPPRRVDILAAAPIVSATSLARSLDIAIKNAAALLDVFVARGIAIEVTHRSKRRLFGLKHLAPLRETAAPPRRALRRHGHVAMGRARGVDDADLPDTAPHAAEPLRLTPLERKEFEFSDLDDWMREADQLIRRSQAVLDRRRAARIGRRRGLTLRDSGRGEGSPARRPPAGRAAGIDAGVPLAGNSCEKAIALPGVLGLPEIRIWLPAPRGARRTRCRCH